MTRLLAHPYPGNVRELENAIEHAFVVCGGYTIQLDDLPPHLNGEALVATPERPDPSTSSPWRPPRRRRSATPFVATAATALAPQPTSESRATPCGAR